MSIFSVSASQLRIAALLASDLAKEVLVLCSLAASKPKLQLQVLGSRTQNPESHQPQAPNPDPHHDVS